MEEERTIQRNITMLANKYVGLGNSEITKYEFQTNTQRDLLASHINHKSRLLYMSISLNEHPEQTRLRLLDKMIQPLGYPSNK